MISDHIEALFLKKQELIKLLENGTLEQILRSEKCSKTQQLIYNEIEIQIKRINSEIKACYNHNSELDDGTQFKIYDRVVGSLHLIDEESKTLDQLMDLIKSEKSRAILENKED